MNSHFYRNIRSHTLALCVLAILAGACAATSVKKTWKSPDFHGPIGKVSVLTVDGGGWWREGFENRFVQQLAKAGTSAQTSFDLLSLDQIRADKRAAGDRLMSGGAQALLILRLYDRNTVYHETRAGSERWAPVVT